jgi:hypothetical protein
MKGAKVYKDKTGKITGVDIPNKYGTMDKYPNINTEQAQSLLGDFNNIPLTQEEQWQKEIDTKKAKDAFIASQNQKDVSPDLLNKIGQIDPNIVNSQDETAQEIARKTSIRKAEMSPVLDVNTGKFNARGLIGLNMVNKASGVLSSLPWGIGNTILSLAGQNEAAREYLEDYKMDDEYAAVSQDISKSITIMNQAIREAGGTGDDEEILLTYNAAWGRLAAAEQQLKMIEDNDQRAYVETIKN